MLFWFLGLAVTHMKTEAVSFRNAAIIVKDSDDEKVLVKVSDIIHVKPLSRTYMLWYLVFDFHTDVEFLEQLSVSEFLKKHVLL
jgi:hypothetical protein